MTVTAAPLVAESDSPRSRAWAASEWGRFAAVAAIIYGSLWLVVKSFGLVAVYVAPDAGHYLADADGLIGRGIRENRHPPLFPILIDLVRLVVRDNLVTIRVTIAASVALLVLSFFIFIRNRTGSTVGDIAATGLFALASTTAELVGWYGGSSLLGLALTLVALRVVSDIVATPTVARSIGGAMAVAAVVLSHPFSAVFLGEVAVAYITFAVVAAALRSWPISVSWRLSVRRGGLLLVVALGAVPALLAARTFYLGVQNPFVIAPSVQQLNLIWAWAFREESALWLSLLGASLVLIPLARVTAGRRGLDLGLAVTALNVAVLLNMAFLQGNSAYSTRSLYFTPVAMAAAFGVVLTALVQLAWRVRPSFRAITALAPASLTILVAALAIQSFSYRLNVVIPYYNTVDSQELAAIQYLAGRSGTVVLTSKGNNLNGGTQYSWLIEGLVGVRAVGYGTSAVSLYAADKLETNAAERFVAGPAVLEDGRLRAAFDGTQQVRIRVFGSVNGTWYPLFDLMAPDAGLQPSYTAAKLDVAGGELESTSVIDAAPAILRLGAADHMLHITIPANQLGRSGKVEVSPAPSSTCSLDRCSNVASGSPTIAGSRINWAPLLEGRSVQLIISTNSTPKLQANGSSVSLGPLPLNQPLTIDVDVAGLTGKVEDVETFAQANLIRDQNIRFLWTWTSSGEVRRLAARHCLALAYQNNEVAIFQVDTNCKD